ncbi:hypothetical protein EZS27_016576 [termite gut metagenome]|uniref:Uncharacterized protein n=1 Tax=termite gut metagenome TaxID=433724 RepID=A0A5J4RNB0_9ZZZZ
MSDVKFKHNMQQIAYLPPPTQRTIARFINLSGWVKCSCQMLEVYHMLSSEEQSVFSFIQANGSFINELSDVVDCVEGIESICKRQGFWRESVLECQLQIRKSLMTGNRRMIQLGCDILNFLKIEATLLKSDDDVQNNSSDIMESVFGTFKARKSPNKLHGFTSFILFIPAHTQLLNSKKDAELYRFKERLERVRLKDIDDWAAENLSSNRVVKRMKTMKKAG